MPVSCVSPYYPHGTCSLPIQKKKARSSNHEKQRESLPWLINPSSPPTWLEGVREEPVRSGIGEVVALCSWDSPLGNVARPLHLTLSKVEAMFRASQATLGHSVFSNVIVFFPSTLHPPASSFHRAAQSTSVFFSSTPISPLQPFFSQTKYVSYRMRRSLSNQYMCFTINDKTS